MDSNGTEIEWLAVDIEDKSITENDIEFVNKKFTWPNTELPRSRGCYNWGPLVDSKRARSVNDPDVCGKTPEIGQYDGKEFVFTKKETDEFDRQLNDGESASGCPICDEKKRLKEYYACSKKFKSMQAKSDTCATIASKLGA